MNSIREIRVLFADGELLFSNRALYNLFGCVSFQLKMSLCIAYCYGILRIWEGLRNTDTFHNSFEMRPIYLV